MTRLSTPALPPNPDPLRPADTDVVPPRDQSPPPLIAFLLVGLAGAVIGFALAVAFTPHANAASRSAASLSLPSRVPLRAPVPQPSAGEPIPPPAATTIRGTASFVGPSFGRLYLALPAGPGVRVRVCGRAACVTRTSTDAGPDLAMQRAGRVADLSFHDFATVCGCDPWVAGLTRVTISTGGPLPTAPGTDTP